MGRSRKNKRKIVKNREEEVSDPKKEVTCQERVTINGYGYVRKVVIEKQIPKKKVLKKTKEEINDPHLEERCKFTLALYTKLIELSPHSEVLYWSRMKCFMMIDQYESALADAKKSVEVNPNFVEVYDNFIKITTALGDFTETEYALTKLSQVDPTNELLKRARICICHVHRYKRLADARFAEGNYDAALKNIEKVLRICTHCMLYKVQKSECLTLLGKYEEAELLAYSVLDRDKMNIDAKYILALCLYQHDAEKAFVELEKILRLNPHHSKTLGLYEKIKIYIEKKEKGNEAFQKKNYKRAHRIYTEAFEIDPENVAIKMKLYYNMAQATFRLGRPFDAIGECTRALKINPKYVKALKTRGLCFMDTTDYDLSIDDFSRAFELEPRNDFLKLFEKARRLLCKTLPEYHAILGVSTNSSTSVLKHAYEKKLREFALARCCDEETKQKMREVNRAWRSLSRISNIMRNKKEKDEKFERVHSNLFHDAPKWRRESWQEIAVAFVSRRVRN